MQKKYKRRSKVMCEIFGVNSNNNYIANDYLKEFYSHSNHHPHGWGLACLDKNEVNIEKEPIQATKSHYLKERLSLPIAAKTVFAHIRYATIGNIEYRNCHPYTKKDNSDRRWTLIHNGTIFEYTPLNKFSKVQKGDTDSERILLYLVEQINKKQQELQRPLNDIERFFLLDTIFIELSKGNKLNLLFYDGEFMYVHTNYKHSLHFLEKENCTIFSTSPLSEENWQLVPFTKLLAYQDGKLVKEGTNHQNEYVDNEENLKFLYQIFSDL